MPELNTQHELEKSVERSVQSLIPTLFPQEFEQWVYERIEELINHLEKHPRAFWDNGSRSYAFEITKGPKYFKVWETVCTFEGTPTDQKSIHCFVEKKTGLVFKPAGCNGPAKGWRYNFQDKKSRAKCYQNCDPYGGYLYR